MISFRHVHHAVAVVAFAAMVIPAPAHAQGQTRSEPFQPEVGQPGKDVVWVPSPMETVTRMLDVAQLTPQDFVVDLGSGDGRNIIESAKRGARGLGVEYNPDMVELSRRNAAAAGVAERAQFVQGDMFAADFSKASVLALFLLPSNLLQLRSKFLDLQPGTRIVANTFSIQDWTADHSESLDNCSTWCTVLLYIVPAKVAGTWRVPQGELTLQQDYQMLTGSLTANGTTTAVSGRLRGDQITLSAGDQELTGRVTGNVIEGTLRGASGDARWTATRAN